MTNKFLKGFGFVFAGWRLMREVPGLKKWVVMPFIIDFFILFGGVHFGFSYIQKTAYSGAQSLAAWLETSYFSFLYYPLLLVFGVIFLLLYIYFVCLVANTVASPFYSVIAEKVLVYNKEIAPTNVSFIRVARMALNMFLVSLVRTILLTVVGVALFIFSFIPGVNLLAAYMVCTLVAFDASDYGLEARGYNLRQRFAHFKNYFAQYMGMGGFVALTVLVPGLILLVMPFAVIGAANMVRLNDTADHPR